MPILRCMALVAVLASGLLASGCFGGKSDSGGDPAAAPPPPGDCEIVYTYAPSFYVINIAGGDAVVVDPFSQDFPLFCDPGEAKAALQKDLSSGRLTSKVDWLVYRVWGEWDDLAAKNPEGGYMLKHTAPLVDWVK